MYWMGPDASLDNTVLSTEELVDFKIQQRLREATRMQWAVFPIVGHQPMRPDKGHPNMVQSSCQLATPRLSLISRLSVIVDCCRRGLGFFAFLARRFPRSRLGMLLTVPPPWP